MKQFLLLLTAVMIFFSRLTGQQPGFRVQKLDSFITKAMNDWHLMGLSMAIVKKDSVILAKGYGYRDLAKKLPMDENTLFPIASCSKTFTI